MSTMIFNIYLYIYLYIYIYIHTIIQSKFMSHAHFNLMNSALLTRKFYLGNTFISAVMQCSSVVYLRLLELISAHPIID